ncbi:conserved hypothetical protein [Neospora caninum Liverpool]|uniref:Uncharacterized protein n=1 Tax=Neospora caninum (strain Liverpool) TaxID=572307 RepID=F0VIH2_NEOCL|nr:conserved hypothetical protein [Neospora caninum Liverpool]CBZ53533.1 conserved hypothetical protein [Neospora caninum Liverpool]|eukprot:XP_003883565.1 conserved hypothetical protein [Neospora caninum Liverpool]
MPCTVKLRIVAARGLALSCLHQPRSVQAGNSSTPLPSLSLSPHIFDAKREREAHEERHDKAGRKKERDGRATHSASGVNTPGAGVSTPGAGSCSHGRNVQSSGSAYSPALPDLLAVSIALGPHFHERTKARAPAYLPPEEASLLPAPLRCPYTWNETFRIEVPDEAVLQTWPLEFDLVSLAPHEGFPSPVSGNPVGLPGPSAAPGMFGAKASVHASRPAGAPPRVAWSRARAFCRMAGLRHVGSKTASPHSQEKPWFVGSAGDAKALARGSTGSVAAEGSASSSAAAAGCLLGTLLLDLTPLLSAGDASDDHGRFAGWDAGEEECATVGEGDREIRVRLPPRGQMEGWFPVLDSKKGIVGELWISVRLSFARQLNPFSSASSGFVRFFALPGPPQEYLHSGVSLLGLVEELLLVSPPSEEDADFAYWREMMRRSAKRPGNLRRLMLHRALMLTRRTIATKVEQRGGNAVLGYRAVLEIDGDFDGGDSADARSTWCVRAFGTVVRLSVPVAQRASGAPLASLRPGNALWPRPPDRDAGKARPTRLHRETPGRSLELKTPKTELRDPIRVAENVDLLVGAPGHAPQPVRYARAARHAAFPAFLFGGSKAGDGAEENERQPGLLESFTSASRSASYPSRERGSESSKEECRMAADLPGSRSALEGDTQSQRSQGGPGEDDRLSEGGRGWARRTRELSDEDKRQGSESRERGSTDDFENGQRRMCGREVEVDLWAGRRRERKSAQEPRALTRVRGGAGMRGRSAGDLDRHCRRSYVDLDAEQGWERGEGAGPIDEGNPPLHGRRSPSWSEDERGERPTRLGPGGGHPERNRTAMREDGGAPEDFSTRRQTRGSAEREDAGH